MARVLQREPDGPTFPQRTQTDDDSHAAKSGELYHDRPDEAVFLDIETTGLSPETDEITLIGAMVGGQSTVFVEGESLEEFPAYIAERPLLVSFNGIQFDVPFLRARFPQARLDQPHIDLRFVLRSLGYRGGLKAIERQLGLQREEEIQGMGGLEAVRLWQRYRRGDRAALERLIRYNLADVGNLIELMEIALGMMATC